LFFLLNPCLHSLQELLSVAGSRAVTSQILQLFCFS
jgi:hypothetical protein